MEEFLEKTKQDFLKMFEEILGMFKKEILEGFSEGIPTEIFTFANRVLLEISGEMSYRMYT